MNPAGGGPEGSLAASFRDPAGFMFRREGVLYRHIAPAGRDEFDGLIGSGLYDGLVSRGLLISHEEADTALSPAGDAYKVIRPEKIPFVSYPYEWAFSQLKEAALTTIEIQKLAIEHGMSMRDASSYNIQFRGGSPIFVDTLSFEALREGTPWVAYRQFCQHFLAPLSLMAYLDPRLGQLLRIHIDGVPLDLTSSLLPRRTRFRPAFAIHIHAHARSQKKHESDTTVSRSSAGFSKRALLGLIDNLEAAVRRLDWTPGRSTWSEYYTEGDSYTAEALEHKKKIVHELIEAAAPRQVWDLGGNVGVFSRLASERGIDAVCFDYDVECVEFNYREIRARNETALLPLFQDLTNPSPGLGWAGTERDSLASRGPVDLAMALAVVHHLAIGNNVPLGRVASWLREISRKLIIEFVPKSDAKVRTLLATREDIFDTYHQEGFEEAFGREFSLLRREPIAGSERILYLMEAR